MHTQPRIGSACSHLHNGNPYACPRCDWKSGDTAITPVPGFPLPAPYVKHVASSTAGLAAIAWR